MTAATYQEFLSRKSRRTVHAGFEADDINHRLFDWQAAIVRVACRRGRFGGFEDCGLGKSLQQLECARQIVRETGGNVLILAPLAVAAQTKREADKFDIACDVTVCRSSDDVRPGINVANYERLHLFDAARFAGVILDEGSIIKSVDGKIRAQVLSMFKGVPYRQTWTATPAPNDYMEIGNQSEFCGVLDRMEMLATYFIHDGGETSKWRLKGHAHDAFWAWLASWAVMMRSPADIGFDANGYDLPPMEYVPHIIETNAREPGMLFESEASTLAERRAARRMSLDERCERAADLANDSSEPWVIWCNLNDEGERLAALIPDAVEVAGRHTTAEKEDRLESFTLGNDRVLITKPRIGGFGLNWQHCPNTAIFPTDSWEQWYQMIRRFWRFGQTRTVKAHYIVSSQESGVVRNVMRKNSDAARMFESVVSHMLAHMQHATRNEYGHMDSYNPQEKVRVPRWM